jgi:hypothetical protein
LHKPVRYEFPRIEVALFSIAAYARRDPILAFMLPASSQGDEMVYFPCPSVSNYAVVGEREFFTAVEASSIWMNAVIDPV